MELRLDITQIDRGPHHHHHHHLVYRHACRLLEEQPPSPILESREGTLA